MCRYLHGSNISCGHLYLRNVKTSNYLQSGSTEIIILMSQWINQNNYSQLLRNSSFKNLDSVFLRPSNYVDECMSSSEQIWINVVLYHQLIICSKWVPSEWEGKQLTNASQQSTSNPLTLNKLVCTEQIHQYI